MKTRVFWWDTSEKATHEVELDLPVKFDGTIEQFSPQTTIQLLSVLLGDEMLFEPFKQYTSEFFDGTLTMSGEFNEFQYFLYWHPTDESKAKNHAQMDRDTYCACRLMEEDND